MTLKLLTLLLPIRENNQQVRRGKWICSLTESWSHFCIRNMSLECDPDWTKPDSRENVANFHSLWWLWSRNNLDSGKNFVEGNIISIFVRICQLSVVFSFVTVLCKSYLYFLGFEKWERNFSSVVLCTYTFFFTSLFLAIKLFCRPWPSL